MQRVKGTYYLLDNIFQQQSSNNIEAIKLEDKKRLSAISKEKELSPTIKIQLFTLKEMIVEFVLNIVCVLIVALIPQPLFNVFLRLMNILLRWVKQSQTS